MNRVKSSIHKFGRKINHEMTTNPYVINKLIDWENVNNDPVFQMKFHGKGQDIFKPTIIHQCQRESESSVLFTMNESSIQDNIDALRNYLRENSDVSHVILNVLDKYNISVWIDLIESVLHNNNISNISLITDSLVDNPDTFITEEDSDVLLRLMENAVNHFKVLNMETNIYHSNQLNTKECQKAILLLQITGINILGNTPILNNINASKNILSDLWNKQDRLKINHNDVFVSKRISKNEYFQLPLIDFYHLYNDSIMNPSQSINGPFLRSKHGKILMEGIFNDDIIALQFINSINEYFCDGPFFAKYNPTATWIDELIPYVRNNPHQFFYNEKLSYQE